jgi:hypothetical protein
VGDRDASELGGVSFDAVACAAVTACFAAGAIGATADNQFGDTGLLERWDGSTWKVAPPPSGSAQSVVNGITCQSTSFCVAVGTQSPGATRALVEHWNGASWAVVPTPVPAGTAATFLNDVVCQSETSCFAVGATRVGSARRLLIEQWDGSAWSIVPTGTAAGTFGGITCPSATRCFAVGGGSVWTWNGTSWSADSSGTTTAGSLGDVSCSSATDCFAVGTKGTCCGSLTTFIRRWNGTTWFTVPSPNPPISNGYVVLRSVSCVAGNRCVAVGDSASSDPTPFIVRWNGTAWSIASVGPEDGPSLWGVSCATSTSCVAVGVAPNDALIEQWDGSTWTRVESAHHPGATFEFLRGVSCLSPTECFAAGFAHAAPFNYTLIERSA